MTAAQDGPAGSTPRVVVDLAVKADLDLALAGVTAPWSVLGGTLASSPSVRPSFVLPADVVPGLQDGDAVVLTDPTSLPLARLDDIRLRPSGIDGPPGSALVDGDLTSIVSDPAWLFAAARSSSVLLVQRPLLTDELDGVVPADSTATVLVPTGSTPDGIPGLVLLDAVRSAAAGRPAVEVEAAPVHWRGTAEDAALVVALAHHVPAPLTFLAATDPRWVAVRANVLDGRVPAEVDAASAAALTAWRPPVDRRGVVVFFTGFSGSGKSSIADALVDHVRTSTRRTITLLDGDVVRTMLSSGLGFDRAGRDLNIRRIGFVAAEIARHHGMAVCAPIAPFAKTRAAVRAMVEQVGDFVLVHVSTPIEECERRDRKGLYARARSGEIPDFTGISSPYEVPTDADLVIDTTDRTLEESLDEVLHFLRTAGWISA